jgi:hypothetical protein
MIFSSYRVQISNMEAVPEARNRSASRNGKHDDLDRLWLSRFEVIEFFAGYAAGGLTQPTQTIRVTDEGIKPWQSLTQPTGTTSPKKGRLG